MLLGRKALVLALVLAAVGLALVPTANALPGLACDPNDLLGCLGL